MPLFSYFGGKNLASEWIYKQIPQNILKNCKIFTEVFSGAFWVYAKNDWSFVDKIIYNDMNPYITNLMMCATMPEFLEKIEKLYQPGELFYFDQSISDNPKEIYDYNYNKFRENFYNIRKELYHDTEGQEIKINMPDLDMGVKYAFLLRHAFSGIPGKKIGYSYSASSYKENKKVPEPKSQIFLRKLKEKNIIDKLKSVTSFEALDFEEHIKKYDSSETIFYVDPPYFSTESSYFRGDEHFGKRGHQRLADVLTNIKGKFILSYYDFEGLDKMYPKDKFFWVVKSFTKATTSIIKDTDGIDKKGYELLIMNFEPDFAKSDDITNSKQSVVHMTKDEIDKEFNDVIEEIGGIDILKQFINTPKNDDDFWE